MQSRTSYSLVSIALLTALACAHQQDPEEIFQDTAEDPGAGGTLTLAGTGSKAGSSSVGTGGTGSSTSKGGSSALPTGKAGTKSTGGGGGTKSTAGADAGGSGGSGGSGTVNMPVEGMSVQFKAQSTDENPVDFVGGELHVINEAAQPFTLTELKIRYYITNEVTDVTPSFIWQWGQFGPMTALGDVKCTGAVTPMAAPKPGADTYIEFTCSTDGILEAGTKLVMSWKVGAQGMGKMLQTDDWSFAATQADNDKIVVLNGNTVVWGIEP
jgi:endoglucanase